MLDQLIMEISQRKSLKKVRMIMMDIINMSPYDKETKAKLILYILNNKFNLRTPIKEKIFIDTDNLDDDYVYIDDNPRYLIYKGTKLLNVLVPATNNMQLVGEEDAEHYCYDLLLKYKNFVIALERSDRDGQADKLHVFLNAEIDKKCKSGILEGR